MPVTELKMVLLSLHISRAGTQTITGRWRSDSLQLLNSTNLSVNGNTDLTGNLDVDGHTDLDHVIVSLASTFSDRVIFDSTNSIQFLSEQRHKKMLQERQSLDRLDSTLPMHSLKDLVLEIIGVLLVVLRT